MKSELKMADNTHTGFYDQIKVNFFGIASLVNFNPDSQNTKFSQIGQKMASKKPQHSQV